MKIDRLKIADALVEAGIESGKASPLARAIGEAYDEAEKDMASTENVNRIIAENRTEMHKIGAELQAAVNRQIIWTVATGFGVASLVFAIVRYA